jgi:photosystem II stability/assembly factor-like uncharacterized protein
MKRLLFCALAFAAASSWWTELSTGVDSNLRGVAVVVRHGATSIWATGSHGAILRSTDAGQSWAALHIPQADTLDFRGVQSFDGTTVYVMSSGEGEQARIYKSTNGGATWELQYSDKRKSFFLDALVCSDDKHCFALSDPVDSKFLLLMTSDGKTWKELPRAQMPAALPQEGAFAASNSCLLFYGKSELYFGTGGAKARVFHSADLGQSWTVSETPVISGKPSQGIFSIVRAGDTVVAVGGDYSDPSHKDKSAAYSPDQGKTWHLAEDLPSGYRSAVDTFDAGFVAVGPTGAETSHDGIHWVHIESPNLNALTFISGKGFAVGPKGLVAQFVDQTEYSTQD